MKKVLDMQRVLHYCRWRINQLIKSEGMHWNHRVMRHVDRKTGEVHFAIHEVYYDAEVAGAVETGWSETPEEVTAETVEGLKMTLEWMLKALDSPVLEYDREPPSRDSK